MKAMRNRLVHVYFDADPKIVWETVISDLPTLVAPLQRLLAEASATSPAGSPLKPNSPSSSQGESDESP
jgi:hypothetical protein